MRVTCTYVEECETEESRWIGCFSKVRNIVLRPEHRFLLKFSRAAIFLSRATPLSTDRATRKLKMLEGKLEEKVKSREEVWIRLETCCVNGWTSKARTFLSRRDLFFDRAKIYESFSSFELNEITMIRSRSVWKENRNKFLLIVRETYFHYANKFTSSSNIWHIQLNIKLSWIIVINFSFARII